MAKNKNKNQKKKVGPVRINNRRALHDYHIREKLECGIALAGTEVKAIREGRVILQDGFAKIEEKTMELWLFNVEIGAYDKAAAAYQHEKRRKRKLLARRREIRNIFNKSLVKGTTLIPLAMYFNERGFIKVEIGVAEGKSRFDKRNTLKKQEANRDMQRAMSRKRIG